jgi:uncharacterized protein YggE
MKIQLFFLTTILISTFTVINSQPSASAASSIFFPPTNQCCNKPGIISVGGTGTKTVTPDIATFTITTSGKGKTTQTAQSNANTQTNAVLTTLSGLTIPSADIQTSWISINP